MRTVHSIFSHWKVRTLTIGCALLAGWSVAALAQTSAPAPAPSTSEVSKSMKETSTSTSVEMVKSRAPENRTPASPEELRAFTTVGGAFALAWLLVTALREVTQWKEFEARKEERLIKDSIEHMRALEDLVRILQPKAEAAKSRSDLAAKLLQTMTDYIKGQTK